MSRAQRIGMRIETPGLVDWGLIESAREQSPGERLLEGGRLFDLATMLNKAGIRMQFPQADEHEVHRIWLERLAISNRIEGRT